MSTATRSTRVGMAMAVGSALTFGTSGPMAKALTDTGWTAGGVVLVRLSGAAVILTLAAAVSLRGRWRPRPAALRLIALYGLVAMAGAQLGFFNAVQTLEVGVALMIEYSAPMLLLVWTSLRSRTMPSRVTLVGAGVALTGLVLVLDPTGTAALDPRGVAWALMAAVCLAAFFVLSEQQHADLPPLVMAAGGTAVGAVVIAVCGVLGVVPLGFSAADTALAGMTTSWIVPAAWLALVATVVAYLSGIGGIIRLGTRSASFVALTEVLFAVLAAWLLLAELPALIQLVGGAGIISGIVLIRRGERGERVVRVPDATPVAEPVP